MFKDNPDFYPTPSSLIRKMLDSIDFRTIRTVLEPSAGKGDIISVVLEKLKYAHNNYSNKKIKYDVDCIEIDENLRYILQGKGYRVVHDDFLTYNSLKTYDLIVANPPFSGGEKHLLKMLEMQKGGYVVCLLNSETLLNPYSNSRKDLVQKLRDYNASIEYIENAFTEADRKTSVTVALIKVNIEKPEQSSIILDELKKQEHHREESTYNNHSLINADFIKGIIEQYNFEVKAGLKLIAEYNALQPLVLGTFKDIIKLEIKDKYTNDTSTDENYYIKKVRAKYWTSLFSNEKFMGQFTSNLKQKYHDKVRELVDYDFSLYNIYSIRVQINKEMIQGVEDTILALFEELSYKHSYYNEMSKNIHYFNGWMHNSAFKINRKVIILLSSYYDLQYSWGGYRPSQNGVIDKLSDIEKVFNYLDGGITENVNMLGAL